MQQSTAATTLSSLFINTSSHSAYTDADSTANSGKRKNVSVACSNCARRHVACDNQRPCQRCVKHGKADCCMDMEHKRKGRPPIHPEDLEARKKMKMEAKLMAAAAASRHPSSTAYSVSTIGASSILFKKQKPPLLGNFNATTATAKGGATRKSNSTEYDSYSTPQQINPSTRFSISSLLSMSSSGGTTSPATSPTGASGQLSSMVLLSPVIEDIHSASTETVYSSTTLMYSTAGLLTQIPKELRRSSTISSQNSDTTEGSVHIGIERTLSKSTEPLTDAMQSVGLYNQRSAASPRKQSNGFSMAELLKV